MIYILQMHRLAGDNGALGDFYFQVRDGDRVAEVKFATWPTEQQIIDAGIIATTPAAPVIDDNSALKRAVLSEVFSGLDGNNPDDLQIALQRYRDIVNGSNN